MAGSDIFRLQRLVQTIFIWFSAIKCVKLNNLDQESPWIHLWWIYFDTEYLSWENKCFIAATVQDLQNNERELIYFFTCLHIVKRSQVILVSQQIENAYVGTEFQNNDATCVVIEFK